MFCRRLRAVARSAPRHSVLTVELGELLTPLLLEEVTELVALHQDTLELVHSWLKYHGVPSSSISRSQGGSWLTVTGVPVSQADQLLCASYQAYKHTGTNETTLRAALRKHSSEESAAVLVNATSGERVRILSRLEDPTITPAVLRGPHKTATYVPAAGGFNAFATLGLQNDKVIQVNGGTYDLTRPGRESSLDIQYTSAKSYPTPQIFYCTGGPIAWLPNGEPGPEDAISYANPEMSVPWTYATSLCNISAQLGLSGVSVLIASGDNGVGHGNNQDGDGNVRFYTRFPASCPWVTSVGGTMNDPETAIPLSGGGFSEYFGRPQYQNGMVQTFLENLGNQYAGFYNALGRGVPDISVQLHSFEFILANELYYVSGTSCRYLCVFASFVLNISTGRYPLGFLNLGLYDRGIAGLNGVASSNYPGCNTPGFSSTTGWDPVTGLGTPDFVRLQLVVDYLIHPVHNNN
ncbi:peptidase S8/S53 domain-containing protein [Lactarius quietus]|nr:peptidase S8/S53 domain-containing protein [Lactarius quietus]